MKKVLSAFIAIVLLLAMSSCARNTSPSTTETTQSVETNMDAALTHATENTTATEPAKKAPESYSVYRLRYPSRLGESVLGEKTAAQLYETLPLYLAQQQVNNIGDALYYLRAMSNAGITFEQPYDLCKLFSELVGGDYDEVGILSLTCEDNGYSVAYILQEGYYFPIDLFRWYQNPSYNTWITYKGYHKYTDLEALGTKLIETWNANPDQTPMTDWDIMPMATYRSQEERDFLAYLTTPQHTQEQLEQWVSEGLTLEQWAEKITVPADAIAALHAIGYRSMLYNDNAEIETVQGTMWGGIWNAQKVFDKKSGNCGGTSHIMNALLSGDFDEQGYVEYNGNNGGHIFNYFLKDGIYVMCDFVDLFTKERTYIGGGDLSYVVFLGKDLQVFAEGYMNQNGHDDPNNREYIYHLFLYAKEGVKHPKGNDAKSPATKFNNVVWDVLPEVFQEDYVFLYEREGFPIRYKPISDPDTWPAILR